MRCLTLANELRQKARVSFISWIIYAVGITQADGWRHG
jgi:ABC-type uncharacterized transport system permease subunit